MKSIRIGNDIHVSWSIYMKDGLPYSLEEKDVRIFLATPYGRVNITDYTIHENVISWVFWGKSQKVIGNYSIILVVNKDNEGMVTTDVCDFVRLVSHSCEAGGKDNDGVQTEVIELTSEVSIGGYDDTEIREELARLETDKADRSELTELSEEVSGLSKKIDNLPSAEDEILKVEYGKTTFQEIKDAYVAGKYIVFEYANNVFHINRVTDTEIYFVSINGALGYRVGLNNKNNWYQNAYPNEQSSNKVTSLSDKSTDTQYPSAKAVYEAIQQSGGKQGVIRQTQKWTQATDKSYSYVMSDIVRGAIPQANIDLFTRVGAVFNEESGYFELNSLTDISYEEMMDIYTYGNVPTLPNIEQYHPIKDIRTTLPIRANTYYNQSMSPSFEYATVESLFLTKDVSPVNAEGLGNGARYLHTLVIPDYSRGKKFWSVIKQLRTCLIARIKANIELPSSYQLTNESILYMIQNEAATSAITITLHADAYDRAMADADIQEALTAHPNVSLAK